MMFPAQNLVQNDHSSISFNRASAIVYTDVAHTSSREHAQTLFVNKFVATPSVFCVLCDRITAHTRVIPSAKIH